LLCLTIQAVVYFGGFFPKLGHFAGFSLYIITNAVWISEAAMGGAGDVILIKKNKTKIGRKYGRKNGSKKGRIRRRRIPPTRRIRRDKKRRIRREE
jgi:hypothetical protein